MKPISGALMPSLEGASIPLFCRALAKKTTGSRSVLPLLFGINKRESEKKRDWKRERQRLMRSTNTH